MALFDVSIKLYFRRTLEEEDDDTEHASGADMASHEPSPSNGEVDEYMTGKMGHCTRYEAYVGEYFLDDYTVSDIRYEPGGIVKFRVTAPAGSGPEDVVRELLDNSLEDGMYEGMPGNEGVYPTKYKYNSKLINDPSEDQSKYEHVELGLIDYRNPKTISVVPVPKKVMIKVPGAPLQAMRRLSPASAPASKKVVIKIGARRTSTTVAAAKV